MSVMTHDNDWISRKSIGMKSVNYSHLLETYGSIIWSKGYMIITWIS